MKTPTKSATISLKELYALLILRILCADPDPSAAKRSFTRVSGFDDATPDSIIFAADPASLAKAVHTSAGLILAPLNVVPPPGDDQAARILQVRNPKPGAPHLAFEMWVSRISGLDRLTPARRSRLSLLCF